MIDLEFVQELIRSIDGSGVDHIEIERGGTRIRISKSPPLNSSGAHSEGGVAPSVVSGVPVAGTLPGGSNALAAEGAKGATEESATESAELAADDLIEVTSPMVGTFYRSPSPGTDPFVDVGERISNGDVLCIIEAMKLMNELESDESGIVREICVEDGEPVEYGQVLFRVEAD